MTDFRGELNLNGRREKITVYFSFILIVLNVAIMSNHYKASVLILSSMEQS